MAFTRQNTGTASTFSRDGSTLLTTKVPAFSTFRASSATTEYSLGYNWSVKITPANKTLDFQYGVNSVLQLTSTGFELDKIVIKDQSVLPMNAAEGTLAHVNDEIFIYT